MSSVLLAMERRVSGTFPAFPYWMVSILLICFRKRIPTPSINLYNSTVLLTFIYRVEINNFRIFPGDFFQSEYYLDIIIIDIFCVIDNNPNLIMTLTQISHCPDLCFFLFSLFFIWG